MLRIRAIKIILRLTLVVSAMLYGMLVMEFRIPPYHFVKAMYNLVVAPKELQGEYFKPSEGCFETNVADLISIKQPQDAERLRGALTALLWGESGFPSSLPSMILKDFKDFRYDNIPSLSRIDKISIKMEFGLESNIYHFIPKTPNNRIILYHEGHGGDFYAGKKQISEFLSKGYSVAAFCMPLLGLNNQPTVYLSRQGNLKIRTHDHMKFLQPKTGHPIKYFIEPVLIALNYFENNFNYSDVSMVGISGGGWTTTLAAALDTRIQKSFPVAGSYPIYLRSTFEGDWGDYEQTTPEVYKTVNYLELYILGSYGFDRKQLQVINQYDSCCFSGTKWRTYEGIVREHVHELGAGEFDLFLDSSHKGHVISEATMKRILDELGSNQ